MLSGTAPYLFLAASLYFVASRFIYDWKPGGGGCGSTCILDPLFNLLVAVLPNFAAAWVEVLRQNPELLWTFVAVFAVLGILKAILSGATVKRAMAAWDALKNPGSPPLAEEVMASPPRGLYSPRLAKALNTIFALVIFVVFVAAILLFIDRTAFETGRALGMLCKNGSENLVVLNQGRPSQPVDFSPHTPCFATGIKLEKGKTYEFEVTLKSTPPRQGATDVRDEDKKLMPPIRLDGWRSDHCWSRRLQISRR